MHPAAAPWPPSHCETARTGIAISGWSRSQTENNCRNCSEKATLHAQDGDESPQGGLTPEKRTK